MSVKLTYEQIRKDEFMSGLAKIYRHEGFKDISLMQRIIRAVRLINKELESAQEIYLKLLKQYARVDEKGAFIPPPGKTAADNLFCIDEAKADEWLLKQKEFYQTEVEIAFDLFSQDAFLDCKLSPVELEALWVICVQS